MMRASSSTAPTVGACGGQLAGQHRQDRIVAQPAVVIEVRITQRDADDALHQQGFDGVSGDGRIAAILEAGGGSGRAPCRWRRAATPGVGGDGAAVEGRNDAAALNR